jgi:hypothetical protein
MDRRVQERLRRMDSDTQDLVLRVVDMYGMTADEISVEFLEDILEDAEMLQT